MTAPLARWRLGEPLAVTLEGLARGTVDVIDLPVGRLAWSAERRVAVFEPAPDAIATRLPLSPHSLPFDSPRLRAGTRDEFGGLQGVFADSLPDGWGNLLIDREAEARGLRRAELTPIHRLAIVGASGMGALVYRPEAGAAGDPVEIDLSAMAGAADRILRDAGEPTLADAVELRQALGGSGGARPKIVCQIEEAGGDAARLRPASAHPDPAFGHWLVKFNAREDDRHAATIEYAYAQMAGAAGIDMPQTRLVTGRDDRLFFAIRRFDREVVSQADGAVRLRRRHMLSASGALESDHRKYAFDYAQLLGWVHALTRDMPTLEEAFRRAAFNAMAHNRDDHGRQHTVLLDQGDNGAWRWRLSPAYDLTPSNGPGGEHSLSFGGVGRDISLPDLLRLARDTGIAESRARIIVGEVAAAVSDWPRFAAAANMPATVTRRIALLHSPVD
ncbi:type II toxin-antitoxin system HipA family toxin [Maricaulis maris]|jgi:serine/threonine-protein kinase HipA|uniref:type II toxin-antitoxin system HipA family toxin n=1 Tax=Maricaulis maris TaxID=74318 RepID=UPI0026F37276|nr:type II toxin-antitoxin system HipA family toxin [Maricaulis maris]